MIMDPEEFKSLLDEYRIKKHKGDTLRHKKYEEQNSGLMSLNFEIDIKRGCLLIGKLTHKSDDLDCIVSVILEGKDDTFDLYKGASVTSGFDDDGQLTYYIKSEYVDDSNISRLPNILKISNNIKLKIKFFPDDSRSAEISLSHKQVAIIKDTLDFYIELKSMCENKLGVNEKVR